MAVVKSERFKLVKEDALKIGKGATLAAAGAFIVYVAKALGDVDFGDWTPFVVAGLAVLVNVARKWYTTNEY